MIFSTVTLGDLSLVADPDAYGVKWRCPMVNIDGWWGSPAPTMDTKQKPRAHGVWVGDSWLPGRSISIRGWVEADTRDQVADALDRLNAACSLSDTTLTVSDSGQSRSAVVRRGGEFLPTWVHPTLAKWSIQLFAADPRKLGVEMSTSTANPSTSGGLTIPFTIPFTIDAQVVSGQVALTNPGTIDGPVWLRIDGPESPSDPPLVAPRITHVNSGRSLVFASSLEIANGEYVTVDMQRREVLAQGQASRGGSVTDRGWSTFEPGSNQWAFTSTSGTGLLTVMTRPAWM